MNDGIGDRPSSSFERLDGVPRRDGFASPATVSSLSRLGLMTDDAGMYVMLKLKILFQLSNVCLLENYSVLEKI